jgi:hypothetical protein
MIKIGIHLARVHTALSQLLIIPAAKHPELSGDEYYLIFTLINLQTRTKCYRGSLPPRRRPPCYLALQGVDLSGAKSSNLCSAIASRSSDEQLDLALAPGSRLSREPKNTLMKLVGLTLPIPSQPCRSSSALRDCLCKDICWRDPAASPR